MVDKTPAARAIEARKSRHLDICLDDDVASHLDAGFSRVRLRHEALPECALEDIDTSTELFGHRLSAPLLISSMTGGTERARSINYNLALAAERAGVALGLGSQRAALEDPDLLSTYQVRNGRAARRAVRQPRRRTAQLRRHDRRCVPDRREHRRGRPVPAPQPAAGSAAAPGRHELP